MSEELALLLVTSATIGVTHTALGPDHWLPFIALARARGWHPLRAMRWTLLCGIGHVIGSVLLGVIGIALGLGLGRLEAVEGSRGELASWLLITFGTLYLAWGLNRALRHRVGEVDERTTPSRDVTGWVLFIVFVLGPCEALIPVLMYPAATASLVEVALVTGVFAVATVVTMSVAVALGLAGARLVAFDGLERYSHALAGATVLACGAGIQILGL